jgi:hypothetical protein
MAGLDPIAIRISGQPEKIVTRLRFAPVMPGLDPGIHAVPPDVVVEVTLHSRRQRHPLDPRVKPGHDKAESDAESKIFHAVLILMPMRLDPPIHAVP